MSDKPTNGEAIDPGAKFSARTDGFNSLFGEAPWSPISPQSQGDNRLYSNMTKYWHDNMPSADYLQLYIRNGIATTIVDRPADDCFARGFEIDGDDDDIMSDEMDRLSVSSTYSDAIRWARLFGGSAILMIVKDGGTLEDELNLNNIDTVEDLKVYDSRHIKPTDVLYTNPTNVMYGKPQLFRITPPGKDAFLVHETRLIPFAGDPIPISANIRSMVWWQGKSALDCCANSILRLERAFNWSERLLERKQQGIYKMEGLGDMFARKQDDIVRKRIALVDHVRNILSSVVVDATDDYTIQNLGLDGLQVLLAEFEVAVCADSQFPSVILFGKSASSLNATGAGDLENFYGLVNRIRMRVAKPALERLISVLWLQNSIEGAIPDNWTITFAELWVPPDKEVADTELVKAQARTAEVTMLLQLMDAGILLPEEVRKIIIEKYSDDYDLPDNPTSSGWDASYARSVGGGNDNNTGDGGGNNSGGNNSGGGPSDA